MRRLFYYCSMISTAELYTYYQANPQVTTDSRKAGAGQLFFALRGERFDGNQYAEGAVESGAAYAVIDDPVYQKDKRFLLVENVLESLQELATYHRRQFSIPIIAITGSNGKTTTKELASVVMNSEYATHFTLGNLNNHIGVPLTLLAMPTSAKVAIIEMGANHKGEIADLCRIAEPTHGLITNIGKAHLEGFGGLEGVKQGKSEMYRYLAEHSGVAFVNKGEQYLSDLSEGVKKRVFYQQSDAPRSENTPYEMKLLKSEPFLEVAYLGKNGLTSIETQLIGKYNFQNVMSAVAIGRYFKVPEEKMAKALADYRSENNRSQVLEKGSNTFVLDAYNANPTSMENALNAFAAREGQQKVVILGDMLELGEYSQVEHLQIFQKAWALFGENVALVGKEFPEVAKDSSLPLFANVAELKVWYYAQHFENTIFLLKGSRGIQLEKLLAK